MKHKVKEEVRQLIKELGLNCSTKEFKDKVTWRYISNDQQLSEGFIREFQDKVDWSDISSDQQLSEEFIREFKNKVDWNYISHYQQLSKEFIREFQDKVYWDSISRSQKLTQEFIREFKNKVNWDNISYYQQLSESFIREFKNKINWSYISNNQKLSEEFIREFQDKINIEVQKEAFKKKALKQKLKEVKAYAKKHNLKYDKDYLYAYRNHDFNGSGIWNKVIKYEKGKYYQDWHCDMRENVLNSFGLGIWKEGSVPIKIKISDWGVAVNKEDSKARVMGFEII